MGVRAIGLLVIAELGKDRCTAQHNNAMQYSTTDIGKDRCTVALY